MSLPLHGYRVIELAQIYAGPYCGFQLAHFGAEVIKIEPVGTGELLRKRPPAKHGTNYGFLMLNTGKKSVSLNIKDPRGRDILLRLLADSDVLLENYAPGALERLAEVAPVHAPALDLAAPRLAVQVTRAFRPCDA